ncbi:DUF4332 domain-containing protein [Acaryochloris sp. IP29b_bin.148]|uniref:DUF4332 domain-containing protein n=1 Tax=Acaryochloris sp. IP29b_bin.148 TaxID=2969218 RepID=UPI002629D5A6|nr:DUF4332 domain-containing protein [Acaryochloris sp. IP29b_bin.148]
MTSPSTAPLAQLPGLSSDHLSQLQDCGITTIRALYTQTQTLDQRQQLAAQLQLHQQYIHKWAALAELSLIPGVGTKHSGLLLHAGVGSTVQLAQMPAERLHRQLLRLHVTMLGQNSLCPTVAEVTQWIFQARRLVRR